MLNKIISKKLGYDFSKNTFSHGDRPMCQIWYANVKAHRNSGWIRTHLEVKGQCCIGSCAKYGKPKSKQKIVMGWT